MGEPWLGVASLYISTRSSDGKRKTQELIYGSKYIEEEILGKRMLLEPSSFFQGNFAIAEKLIEVIKSRIVGEHRRNATLLDICCGAGFYSLQLADMFRSCIGVDITNTRIAAINAEMNGLKNCSFITGKVENLISSIAVKIKERGNEVVAVVNPGRRGLKFEAFDELRKIPFLTSIIYIACEPEGHQVQNNLITLMKNVKGIEENPPFSLRE